MNNNTRPHWGAQEHVFASQFTAATIEEVWRHTQTVRYPDGREDVTATEHVTTVREPSWNTLTGSQTAPVLPAKPRTALGSLMRLMVGPTPAEQMASPRQMLTQGNGDR